MGKWGRLNALRLELLLLIFFWNRRDDKSRIFEGEIYFLLLLFGFGLIDILKIEGGNGNYYR